MIPGVWMALVGLLWLSVFPVCAELYRWTDATGKVHITDNLATIPPAYRDRVRSSGGETPATEETPPDASPREPSPAPPIRDRSQPPIQETSAPTAPPAADITALEEQMATARQERQTYFTELVGERMIHANPLFVRQRRQIAELGQALLTVEQRLDALQTSLEQAQRRRQTRQSPGQTEVLRDQGGHDASYWQQRSTAAREQVEQVRTQRRALLAQLAEATSGTQYEAGRQGREILRQAQELQQIDQALDTAEAALQTVQQEALQAGAPSH